MSMDLCSMTVDDYLMIAMNHSVSIHSKPSFIKTTPWWCLNSSALPVCIFKLAIRGTASLVGPSRVLEEKVTASES